MVDVSQVKHRMCLSRIHSTKFCFYQKSETCREAGASSRVCLSSEAFIKVKQNQLKKVSNIFNFTSLFTSGRCINSFQNRWNRRSQAHFFIAPSLPQHQSQVHSFCELVTDSISQSCGCEFDVGRGVQ